MSEVKFAPLALENKEFPHDDSGIAHCFGVVPLAPILGENGRQASTGGVGGVSFWGYLCLLGVRDKKLSHDDRRIFHRLGLDSPPHFGGKRASDVPQGGRRGKCPEQRLLSSAWGTKSFLMVIGVSRTGLTICGGKHGKL